MKKPVLQSLRTEHNRDGTYLQIAVEKIETKVYGVLTLTSTVINFPSQSKCAGVEGE